MDHSLTKRELFSWCGKLTAHYPGAGWLRVVCSFVKQYPSGERWDEYIGDLSQEMIMDIMHRVSEKDPVSGIWKVQGTSFGTMWCDGKRLG